MNNSSIVAVDYNGLAIATRTSDGWVNLTQMCKATKTRIDNWTRLDKTQRYIKSLSKSLGSEGITSSVLESTRGKHGGTWGHPLLALELAQWIDEDFAVWCNAHIFVLMKDGVTTIDQNPFERMMEIMAEDYDELDKLMPNDDRFGDAGQYSNWSLYSEDY